MRQIRLSGLTILSIVLLTGVMLNSCTIQKRKYLHGFYVQKHSSVRNNLSNELKPDNNNPNHVKLIKKETELHKSEIPENKDINQIKNSNTETSVSNKPISKRIIVDSLNSSKIDRNNIISNTRRAEGKNHDSSKVKYMKTTTTRKRKVSDRSKRNTAIIIGISLLLMAIIAGISVSTSLGLLVLGNPATTFMNLTSSFAQFSAARFGWLAIFLLDILVSIGIYKHYKKKDPKLAAATGGLRLLYTAILGVAIVPLFLITKSSPASAVYSMLNTFSNIWGIGLIVFGLHLIALGLLYKNENGKKWITILIKCLLILAGIGYCLQYIGILLVPNPIGFAALMQSIFIIPMILGEVAFAIWMLVKGGTTKKVSQSN